ncbi:MAG: glycosyltransferase family 2 protein [Lachnospiraceae bacterium]|jgi:teichuronic acid biosynthesis glycosyltransferase TuaG|nr:glycosyltransferase family 2 protein [Lachnospiraceae bacterium]MCI1328854.1 glycosyltransferase family 2 protein [Lachnospiraceae bacterium]
MKEYSTGSDSSMVSVIVPAYNCSDYIEDTIRTVAEQTYTNWELILVDDKSTDDTVARIQAVQKKLAAGTASKIRLIEKTEDTGAADTRNTGISAARGRYIAFLDSDDLWHRRKLELELRFMKQCGAGFAFTAYHFGDENGRPTGKITRVPSRLTFRRALSRTVIFTSTVLLDTERIDRKLIHMPEIPSEDTAMWWTILKSGVTAYGLDRPLATYRRHGGTLSSNKAEAVRRIWNLYRNVADLSVPSSAAHLVCWAWNATMRRTIPDRARNHSSGR